MNSNNELSCSNYCATTLAICTTDITLQQVGYTMVLTRRAVLTTQFRDAPLTHK